MRPRSELSYCTYLVNAGERGRPDPSLRFGSALITADSDGPWYYALAVCNLEGHAGYPDDVTVFGVSSESGHSAPSTKAASWLRWIVREVSPESLKLFALTPRAAGGGKGRGVRASWKRVPPASLSRMPDSPVSDAERLRVRERPPGRAVMRQVWRHLGFLHWPVARAAIAPLLPPGLQVDTFDGAAYVGVVPFTIPLTRTALGGLPIAPAFHELNVRTYVHRDGRDPGVWFFSLDAASRLAVAGARVAYGLPYFHARMSMEVGGGGGERRSDDRLPLTPRLRRRGVRWPLSPDGCAPSPRRPARSSSSWPSATCFTRGPAAPCAPPASPTPPYPLQPAVADGVAQTLTDAARLPPDAFAAPPPLVHYAREVDVAIFGPAAPLALTSKPPSDR